MSLKKLRLTAAAILRARMSLSYVKAMLHPKADGTKILVHICNDIGKMGQGLCTSSQ